MDEDPQVELYVSSKQKFYPLLEVPLLTKVIDLVSKYFSRLNTHHSLPSFLYSIFAVISIVQIISPSWNVWDPNLWSSESFLREFFRGVSSIGQGYNSDDGYPLIYAVLVFSIISIIFFIISACLIITLPKRIMRQYETYTMIVIIRFFVPLLIPLTFSGISYTSKHFYCGSETPLDWVCIFLFPIQILLYSFSVYCLTPRILFEPSILLEWHPSADFIYIAVASIQSSFSVIVGFANRTTQIVITIIMAIIYIFHACYILYCHAYVNRNMLIVLSSLLFSSGFTCIFDLISISFSYDPNSIIIIVNALLFIIFFFVINYIMRKLILKTLDHLNELFYGNYGEANDDEFFTNYPSFLSSMRRSFQFWHPYLLSWVPFRKAHKLWPQFRMNIDYQWARMVAIFPSGSDTFQEVLQDIAKVSKHIPSYSFALQMQLLLNSRDVQMSPFLQSQFNKSEKDITRVKLLQHRMMEDILQHYTSNFWCDVQELISSNSQCKARLMQLVESYPNNPDVIMFFCRYLRDTNIDPLLLNHWMSKLAKLKSGSRLKDDLAYSEACPLFPELAELVKSATPDRPQTTTIAPNSESKVVKDNTALQEVIEHARVGSQFSYIIIIVIAAIAMIVFFYLVLTQCKDATENISNFMVIAETLAKYSMDSARLAMYMMIYPVYSSIDADYGKEYVTQTVAVEMYPAGVVPLWELNTSTIIDQCSIVRSRLMYLQTLMASVRINDKKVYNSLFVDNFKDGQCLAIYYQKVVMALIECVTFQPDVNLLLKDPRYIMFETLFPEVLNIVNELYPIFKESAQVTVEYDSAMIDLLLSTTISLTVLTIALPFFFSEFSIHIVMEMVAKAYSSLPNSEIRRIIVDNDEVALNGLSSHAAVVKNGSQQYTHMDFVPIGVSILGVIAILYYVHYDCLSRTSYLNDGLTQILATIGPATHIYKAGSFLGRIAIIDNTDRLPVNDPKRMELFDEGNSAIDFANDQIGEPFWIDCQAGPLYIAYRPDVSEIDLQLQQTEAITLIEAFIAMNYTEGVELSIVLLRSHYQRVLNALTDLGKYQTWEIMYGLTAIIPKRDDIFIRSMSQLILEHYDISNDQIVILLSVFALFLVAVALYVVWKMDSRRRMVKQSLQYLMLFDPDIVMRSNELMSLLNNKQKKKLTFDHTVEQAEDAIWNVTYGVIIIGEKLEITFVNPAACKILQMEESDLIKRPLSKILTENSSVYLKVSDQFKSGICSTTMSAVLHGCSDINCTIDVIGLRQNESGRETLSELALSVGLVIEDMTNTTRQIQSLEEEQKRLDTLLMRALPAEGLRALQKPDAPDCFAFSTSSATIATIHILTPSMTLSQTIDVYKKGFAWIEASMAEYPLISPICTYSGIFKVGGGLFDEQVKTERHAEEVVRFCLKLEENEEYQLRVGINTGGPLVGGIPSTKYPFFDLFGDASDAADEALHCSKQGQVVITQSVKELVESTNLKIQPLDEYPQLFCVSK